MCGVSECNCKASIMRRPWPTRVCCAIKKLRLSVNLPAVNVDGVHDGVPNKLH